MKLILTSNGYHVQVSDEDFSYLNQFGWQILLEDGVPRNVQKWTSGTTKKMSHVILEHRGIQFSDEIDHKDRNIFNNQFENLRPADRCQQNWNRGKFKNNTTSFTGVARADNRGYHLVLIGYRGAVIYIGRFKNPIDGAKAYDQVCKRLHGEFAVLNFPEKACIDVK